jgi:copper chaperone
MTQIILNVPDISCEHCERTITNTLAPVDGVRGVSVDIAVKQVRVDYDETQINSDRMKQLLEAEDYPVASADPA